MFCFTPQVLHLRSVSSEVRGEGLRLKIIMPRQHQRCQCTICKRWMRSDNLKSHMKTHKDLLDLSDDQLEEVTIKT